MRDTAPEKSNLLRILLIAISLTSLVIIGLTLLRQWEDKRGIFAGSHTAEDTTLVYNGVKYEPKKRIDTFLILGLDKFEGAEVTDSYNNDQQADFLMLFVFDNDTKEYSVIHINRDAMADINILGVAGNKVGTTNKQIALAHTYGNGKDVSCRNTADAVSELLLGVKVNHYVSLKMDAVGTVNDLVGGVQVEILDDFTGVDDTLVKGQTVNLMGEHALNYVRMRRGLENETNAARMARQQQYLLALQEKLVALYEEEPEEVLDILKEISDYTVSDRSVTQLQSLFEKFEEYEFLGIKELDGESRLGEEFIEFYPDAESVTKTVAEVFYKPVSDQK